MDFVVGLSVGFVSLVLLKTVAEPLAIAVGKILLGKVHRLIPLVFDELDQWLPTSNGADVGEWLVNSAIPLVAQSQEIDLDEDKILAIAGSVIKNFKLGAYNAKLR